MCAYGWEQAAVPPGEGFLPENFGTSSNLHEDLIEINMKCLEFITNGESCLENPEKMKS